MTSGVSGKTSCLIWNYRKVLELLSIGGPSQSRDMVELTSHDSTDQFKEFVPGPIAGGEVSLEGNLIVGDAAGQIAFHTDIQGGTKRNAFIVMPMAVGGALFFAAYATGFGTDYPFDSKIAVSGSLVVTGKPLLLVDQSAGMSDLTGKETNDVGDALVITPAIAVGTYAYACAVGSGIAAVVLTATAGAHIVYIQGALEATGVETDPIALGAAGTTTDILIIVHEGTAAIPTKAPRLYILSVARAAA